MNLGWLPAGNRQTIGDGSPLDLLHHLIAPALVSALVETAMWGRFMRSSMLEVVNQDYIRTARATGTRRMAHPDAARIAQRAAADDHRCRPSISDTASEAASVTETVFTWPGMVTLFLDSIGYRDYPVVMGILMFSATMVLIGSLLADILYAVVDPRIGVG